MGDRVVCHSAALDHPGQSLDVEWVREADWDRHWAVVFTGVTCRQEVRRTASYTEARAYIDRHLERRAAGLVGADAALRRIRERNAP